MKNKLSSLLIPHAITILLLTGCAGSAGSTKALQPLQEGESPKRFSYLSDVQGQEGVMIQPPEIDRITQLIIKKIREHEQNHFKDLNTGTNQPNTLHASVLITNYDEGSAFARFMLAGLGQIHIDGELSLTDMQTQKFLAKHEVTKTFAWGDIRWRNHY